jgi:hypothetical protein
MRSLHDALMRENERLRAEIAAATANIGRARPWVDLWAGLAVGLGLIVGGVAVAWRRHRAPAAVTTSRPRPPSTDRKKREPARLP